MWHRHRHLELILDPVHIQQKKDYLTFPKTDQTKSKKEDFNSTKIATEQETKKNKGTNSVHVAIS